MNGLLRRSTRLSLVAIAGLALAGGLAYAAIPGSGNVFTACMVKSSGAVRLIDPSLPKSNKLSHCKGNEKRVSWNQTGQRGAVGPQGPAGSNGSGGGTSTPGPTGPAGATGAAGAAGATGATGAQGPSDGFFGSMSTSTPITVAMVTVVTVNLPAGKYIVNGSARVISTGVGTNTNCVITGGGSQSLDGNVNLGAVNDRKMVSINFAPTFAAAGALVLKCGITSGATASADEATLSAIKVGSVNGA